MMTKHNKLVQWMFAVVVGVFLAAFSYGACTAQAAETTVEAQEQAPADSNAENGGGAMILLMGGMLIIILAVVLSVVGTFVSSAAIVDEL